MVCSALIKDEKQQQRAAPTNKPRAGRLWCCRSPELIQIQGLGLPSPEGTAEIWRTKSPKQLETLHSPTVMLLASIYWWKNSPSPTPLLCSLENLEITATPGKIHPWGCIPVQQYNQPCSFYSPSPRMHLVCHKWVASTSTARVLPQVSSSSWISSIWGKCDPYQEVLDPSGIYKVSLAISLCLPVLQRGSPHLPPKFLVLNLPSCSLQNFLLMETLQDSWH